VYVTGHAIYSETHIEVAVTQHTSCNMMAVNYDTICMTQHGPHTHWRQNTLDDMHRFSMNMSLIVTESILEYP
jgi:carbonic anhydrase